MGQKVNIPSQNQPFRRQASIGGNVSFRNIGENEDNSFITLAKVTRVYYKQGKLDFKLTNTNSLVADQSGNGSGSAPIPVDLFGRRKNGQVFGHYRPVKIGDLIAVAYVNGHKSSPIVIGVYPNSGQDYEIISPSLYLDGDDNDSGVAETALAEQKIYPSMQLEYRSGSGTIAKALNGHSFLVVDDETSVQYSKLWQNYETVGFFHSNSDDINPLKETAGDWLLIHEDNPLSDDGDNHRTRFFVNKKGEIQIVLMDNTSSGTISVLEGSKDNGFTISQYYDLTKTKSGDLSDDVYEPDFKSATDYVSLNIGKGKQIALDAAGQTKLIIKKDGIYYNGKPLSKAVINDESNSITNYVKDQITSSDDWKNFQDTLNKASSEARAAAESARQAGEIAKQAGISAEAAGTDAQKTGDHIKKNVIYYANKYKGLHPGLHLDGDVVAITGKSYIEDSVINSAMIENGAIDHAKIAYEAVGSSQIEDVAITRAKIAYAAIGSAQIEDAAITDAKIGSLSADKITTGTLDAGKINVVNLNAKSIKAGTITADKLKIGQLSDITGDAGQITGGKIIVKGNGKNSGVSLEGLDADNPDVYTPSKKAVLANIVHAIKSSAEASLDYAKQVGLSNDPVAIDLQNKYDAMVSGLAPIFNDMSVSTNFDHNTVERLTSACNNAIDKFQNLANSQLNRKIGQTADNKNSVYQGYEQPANPHNNDIWFQENSDGTYQIRVYDGGSWISPGMQDIKEVQKSVSTLPRAYYSSTQPTGTDYKDGDIWYKTSTDTTNNTVVYTAYKWNHNTNTWDPLLDATSSHNYVGSAPASPLEGDFWMDNTTLKQYQNGAWKTIPTQGPQGVPGVSAKQQYIHIAYATSADGKNNFSVDSFSGATYIGLLVDFNEGDSKDPTKYTWSLMKGTDGTDGKDGVPGKPGADGKTSYVHFAYANSSDGTANFNLEYFDNALYIGTYTDFTKSDSKDHTKYIWSRLKGDKGANGKDGVPGKDGKDGISTYVWIRYSNSKSGYPMFRSPVGATYIGIATGKTSSNESSVPTDYKWTKIKGEQGVAGTPGTDGKTPYVHIAYANSADGNIDFTTDGTKASQATINNNPYQYKGTYVDYNQDSSQDHTMYIWTMIYDKSKKRNFTEQPTTPYNVGDTWTQSGFTKICKRDKLTGAFDASDWTMQQLTIHSLDSSVTNSLYNDNLVISTDRDIVIDDTANTGTNGWRFTIISLTQQPKVGDQITVSAEGTLTGRGDLSTYDAILYDPNTTFARSNSKRLTAGKRSSATLKVTNLKGNGDTVLLIYAGNISDTEGKKNVVHHLKVEFGSVATPWCLSQSELTTTTRDYKGVTLNDRGLTATAGSTTVAMNSNDGFLIRKKDDGEVFHVDTSGNLNMKGNIIAGNISGVNFIGDNLTLNNSLQVINGDISADNGNVVINSNGLTLKDGGLKIVNRNNETTTWIRDDGTFSTIQGYFAGTVKATSLTLAGEEAYMDVGAGKFHVDSNGKVAATSISITGNRKDNVNNSASLNGVSIYNGSVIEGSIITGGKIIGSNVIGGKFSSKDYGINGPSVVDYDNKYVGYSSSKQMPNFYVTPQGELLASKVIRRNELNTQGSYNPYMRLNSLVSVSDNTTGSGRYTYHKVGTFNCESSSSGIDIIYNLTSDADANYGFSTYNGTSKICFVILDGTTKVDDGSVINVVLENEVDETTKMIEFTTSTGTKVSSYFYSSREWHYLYGALGDLQYSSVYDYLFANKSYEIGALVYQAAGDAGFFITPKDIGTKESTYPLTSFYSSEISPSGSVSLVHGDYNLDSVTIKDEEQLMQKSDIRRNLMTPDSIMLSTTTQANRMENTYDPNKYYTNISSEGIEFSEMHGNGKSSNPARLIFDGDNGSNGVYHDLFGNIWAQPTSWAYKWRDRNGDMFFQAPTDANSSFQFWIAKAKKHGPIQIGWVHFGDSTYNRAGNVPAIYNAEGHLKGIALYDRYMIFFIDAYAYNATDRLMTSGDQPHVYEH